MDQNGFRDRNHRYSYLIALENARRIAEDPDVLNFGCAHLDRFAPHDPRQSDGYRLWSQLLQLPRREIASRLVERSPHGDYVRETAPSFGALPNAVRTHLLRLSASPIVNDVLPDQGS